MNNQSKKDKQKHLQSSASKKTNAKPSPKAASKLKSQTHCRQKQTKLSYDECEDIFEEFKADEQHPTVNHPSVIFDHGPTETIWHSTWDDDNDDNILFSYRNKF